MRGVLCVLLVVAACVPFSTATRAAQTGSDTFTQLVNRYVAESEARDPLFADSIGVHAYDDRLPDLSPSGRADTYAWEAAWRTQFAALDSAALTLGEQADLRAVLDQIDADLLEAKTIRPYETDPSIYTGA